MKTFKQFLKESLDKDDFREFEDDIQKMVRDFDIAMDRADTIASWIEEEIDDYKYKGVDEARIYEQVKKEINNVAKEITNTVKQHDKLEKSLKNLLKKAQGK